MPDQATTYWQHFNQKTGEITERLITLPALKPAIYGSFISPKLKGLVEQIEDMCFKSYSAGTSAQTNDYWSSVINSLVKQHWAEYIRCLRAYESRQAEIMVKPATAVLPFDSPQSDTLLKPEYAAKSVSSHVTDTTEKLIHGEIGKDFGVMGDISGGIGSAFEGLEDEAYDTAKIPIRGDLEDQFMESEYGLKDQAVMDQNLDENDEMILTFDDPAEPAKDNNLLPILAITGVVFLWLMK